MSRRSQPLTDPMQLRILHVVGDSKYGGGDVVIERLASEARRRGHQASVLAGDPVVQERLRKAGVGVVDLDCIWRSVRPFRDLAGLVRLRRHLSAERYDIVHTHTSKAGVIGRLAARWARVPVVIHTVHGFAFHEGSVWHEMLLYCVVERGAAHFCDALVTVSQFHCDWAAQLRIGNVHTRVAIPNGIDPSRVRCSSARAEVRARLGFRDRQILCLTAGRLAKQKGIDILLQALAKVKEESDIHLLLAGDGEERQALERMTQELGLETRVTFLGFRTDLGDLLSAVDMVVLPSLWEGLSISLLEAMAAAKPIVTTDIGSNLEVTGNGKAALIVTVGSVKELAGAIVELARDTKRRAELGAQALVEFERNYREERMLSRYMNLYARLVRAKCGISTVRVAN